MMQKLNCEFEIAKNGKETIEKFKENHFNLILMDIQMPLMDGIEATKIIKERFKNVPPIIGLSANAMEGDAEKYILEGMDDYLTKPYTLDELYAKMTYWVNRRNEIKTE
jgi:two-component system, OmpR family, aerobic respiration control sensor histidine kinase ArcB